MKHKLFLAFISLSLLPAFSQDESRNGTIPDDDSALAGRQT